MLDDLDHRLIALLRANSRTPVAVLARGLSVNRSTVTSRIERLVDTGVIEAFTLRVSNDVDRDAIRGVTTLVTAPNAGQAVVREIRGYPEVERLHSTTGAWDLVAQLRCRNLSEFDLVLERIRAVPGVKGDPDQPAVQLPHLALTTRRIAVNRQITSKRRRPGHPVRRRSNAVSVTVSS